MCQLAELQVLHLKRLENLQFLCSRCTSSTFGKLKVLKLIDLDVFEGFCEAVHGCAVAFPQLELLEINSCKNLAALPEASYCGGDHTVARSAFPELKKLVLRGLRSFERWEAAALETEEGHAIFPLVECVHINRCPKLKTLPRAPKLKSLFIHGVNEHLSLGGGDQMYDVVVHFVSGWRQDGTGRRM